MRHSTRILANLLTALLLALPALAQQDVINTVIGGGPSGMPAVDADLYYPFSVSVDSSNNYYITDQGNRVFKVSSTGELTLVAGTGFSGYSGDGVSGGATQATLDVPYSAVADAAGNIYISDSNNCVIRKVAFTAGVGTITTIAGEGPSNCGYNGETSTDGNPATDHMLNSPVQIALDSAGADLYIADQYNCRIRKLVLATDAISTVAGTGNSPTCGYSGDKGKAIAAEIYYPNGVAVDSSGNLFIADTYNYVVRKVTASSGVITTVAGTDPTSINGGYTVCSYAPPTDVCGDGAAATLAALGYTYYLAVNSTGTAVTISDYYNLRIRQFTVGGKINTVVGNGTIGFCGDGGPALSACLYYEDGVAVDSSGDIYIADFDNARVRAVNTHATPVTLAGVSIPAGDIQTVGGNGSTNLPTPVTDVPALGVVLYNPFGVMEDPSGDIFTSDTYNNNVREDVAGTVNIIAGTGVPGYSGDGGPATSAQLYYPTGVARDSSGNIYIADQGNCLIRMVNPSGTITTFAGLVTSSTTTSCGYSGDGGPATSAELYDPVGVFVDSANHVWIADTYNSRIREVVNGTINTVVGNGTNGYAGDGGPAASAELYYPYDMRVDAAGNIFIADTYNCRIRQVNATTKVINTIAGNGACAFSGDGPALENSLSYPATLSVDANDNVFIADTNSNRLRWLDPAGTITTFAGSTYGFSGDGGVATSALLATPEGVYENGSGNFLVADSANYRIRSIASFNAVGRSVSSIAFDIQAVNTTSNPVLATLSGIGSPTISSITATAPFAEADNCGSLTNGATCDVYVFFTPTATGLATGTLTITDNGFLGTTQTISLRGTGAGVAVTPGTINFGVELLKVASAAKTVTVRNDSTATITGLSVSLINTADFAIATNTCGSTLASKASCTVGVTFAPQSINARKGTLVVIDSDPTSPQLVGLSGTGTEVEFSETTVNFGSVTEGTTSPIQSVTLTNLGSTKLTITKGALSGANAADFTAPDSPVCGGTVSASGGTCTLNFTFKPSKVGAESATWTVNDNGGGTSQKLTLAGTGAAPANK